MSANCNCNFWGAENGCPENDGLEIGRHENDGPNGRLDE